MIKTLSLELETSYPSEVNLVSILETAYVIFPTVIAAKTILYVNSLT